MKKAIQILLAVLVLLVTLFVFRDPIIDFLPIDQSRWVERDGNRYLLDEDGDPRVGWYSDGEARYYFREDGVMHTGWLDEDRGRCYFGTDGRLHTGWLELDGRVHYLDAEGFVATGWLESSGKRYFLDENGTPVSGWHQVGEKICYVTQEGTIPIGWLEVDGQKYYLNERGFRYSGWLDSSNGRYYFGTDGVMATGWLIMGGNAYYMGSDGVMAAGWTEIDGKTYYFDESGCRYQGWLELDGKRYYIGTDGILRTGWFEQNGNLYYLREDGTPAVGKLEIDGQNYFFTSMGVNFIMVNPWNPLPEGFEVELVQVPGAWLDPICQDALEQMLDDCRAAGFNPRIVSSYRSIADQRVNLQNMVNSMGGDYAAATKIVAVPGTSEHHLGLAFDIVDAAYPKLNHQQAQMPTQKWLMENSWKYGFIMRYPEGTTDITGIIYEPWHYRYVGKELAAELYELGVCLEVYIDNLTNDGTTCGGQKSED